MKKLVIIGLSLFIFFGCNEKKEEQVEETTSAKSELQKAIKENEEGIHIVDSWVRPAAMNRNTGVFLRVMNHTNENDTLVKAISTIAEKTEVHETFKQGEDMMGMREVEYLVMEAGKVFVFKPMSYHIMLINLNETLTVGKTIDLTLIFKNAGEVKINAVVEDKMPTMKAGEEKEKTEM
ncbi:MAG: copper chaperone PCu(A)C [Melioribacteraceae bacterium]|jgi:copper(I)-binding protein|nr:MAG: copper chaperone PCu(A)C [Ignavibacteriales bacterium]WKZ69505.1 MAG: copper chaperone PCu(A)C [Melioribacteraceae bacterium]